MNYIKIFLKSNKSAIQMIEDINRDKFLVSKIEEIRDYEIREYDFDFEDYQVYGLRMVDEYESELPNIGEELETSYNWYDGEMSTIENDTIGGTSAVNIRDNYFKSALDVYRWGTKSYYGTPIIIAGYEIRYGQDPHEVIIKNAIRIY